MQRRRADCHHSTAKVVALRAVRRVYSKKNKKKTLCSNRIYIIVALIVPLPGKVRNPPPSRRTVVKATKARVQRERVSGLEK